MVHSQGKKLRNCIKIVVWIIVSCILIFLGIYFFRLLKLGFFKNQSEIRITELTIQQKVSEITNLIEFVNENFPYTDIIQSEKGLKDVHSVESSLIKRAKNSKDDKEYLKVVLDYLNILKQGTGHVGLFNVNKKPESNFENGYWYLGLKHKLSAKSFFYQHYWTGLFQQINAKKWVHSNLDIVYDNGFYKTMSDFNIDNKSIPKGSIIKTVDGIEVDSFVYNHWNDYWLRFDPHLEKSYCCIPNPLVVNADTSKQSRDIIFETPRKELHQMQVPKLKGFKNNHVKPDFEGNVRCMQLSKDVGYIKIKHFLNYPAYLEDFKTIESFVNDSSRQFRKLIIDLRGNSGGAPVYWKKLFVERFIHEPGEVVQYGAIKKSAWQKIKQDHFLSRPFTFMDIDEGNAKCVQLSEVPVNFKKYEFLNSDEWYFYRNTWTFKPKKTFDFKGKLYYVIDNDCFSATDNFAIAIKQLELGKLIGSNTSGGAMTICEPWYFELPHSHMVVQLEIQLTFNEDGSINTINGTAPHEYLDKNRFPTPYPISYEKENLLQDEWIKHIVGLSK